MISATPSPPSHAPRRVRPHIPPAQGRVALKQSYADPVPLYDFRCRACQATFEEYVPVATLAPCPQCGAPDAERVLTGFAGPHRIGLRGGEAKRSDASRRAREERRREGFARQREQRRQQGE